MNRAVGIPGEQCVLVSFKSAPRSDFLVETGRDKWLCSDACSKYWFPATEGHEVKSSVGKLEKCAESILHFSECIRVMQVYLTVRLCEASVLQTMYLIVIC